MDLVRQGGRGYGSRPGSPDAQMDGFGQGNTSQGVLAAGGCPTQTPIRVTLFLPTFHASHARAPQQPSHPTLSSCASLAALSWASYLAICRQTGRHGQEGCSHFVVHTCSFNHSRDPHGTHLCLCNTHAAPYPHGPAQPEAGMSGPRAPTCASIAAFSSRFSATDSAAAAAASRRASRSLPSCAACG